MAAYRGTFIRHTMATKGYSDEVQGLGFAF
jgi:hypothetical protein